MWFRNFIFSTPLNLSLGILQYSYTEYAYTFTRFSWRGIYLYNFRRHVARYIFYRSTANENSSFSWITCIETLCTLFSLSEFKSNKKIRLSASQFKPRYASQNLVTPCQVTSLPPCSAPFTYPFPAPVSCPGFLPWFPAPVSVSFSVWFPSGFRQVSVRFTSSFRPDSSRVPTGFPPISERFPTLFHSDFLRVSIPFRPLSVRFPKCFR